MSTIARFPLCLVRAALGYARATDHRLVMKFGYIRAKMMRPAVWSHIDRSPDGAYAHTYCGALPLIGSAWINATDYFRLCHVAYLADGGVAFPG